MKELKNELEKNTVLAKSCFFNHRECSFFINSPLGSFKRVVN